MPDFCYFWPVAPIVLCGERWRQSGNTTWSWQGSVPLRTNGTIVKIRSPVLFVGFDIISPSSETSNCSRYWSCGWRTLPHGRAAKYFVFLSGRSADRHEYLGKPDAVQWKQNGGPIMEAWCWWLSVDGNCPSRISTVGGQDATAAMVCETLQYDLLRIMLHSFIEKEPTQSRCDHKMRLFQKLFLDRSITVLSLSARIQSTSRDI